MFEKFKARRKLADRERMIIGLNSVANCLQCAVEENRREMFSYLLQYDCKKPEDFERASGLALAYNRSVFFDLFLRQINTVSFASGNMTSYASTRIKNFMLMARYDKPTYIHDQLYFLNEKLPADIRLCATEFMKVAFTTGRTRAHPIANACGELAPACSMEYYFEKDEEFHKKVRQSSDAKRQKYLWNLTDLLLTSTENLPPAHADRYIDMMKDTYADDMEMIRASATDCLINLFTLGRYDAEIARRIFLVGIDFDGRRAEVLAAAHKSGNPQFFLNALMRAGYVVEDKIPSPETTVSVQPVKKPRLRLQF